MTPQQQEALAILRETLAADAADTTLDSAYWRERLAADARRVADAFPEGDAS